MISGHTALVNRGMMTLSITLVEIRDWKRRLIVICSKRVCHFSSNGYGKNG